LTGKDIPAGAEIGWREKIFPPAPRSADGKRYSCRGRDWLTGMILLSGPRSAEREDFLSMLKSTPGLEQKSGVRTSRTDTETKKKEYFIISFHK